jgi:hypothetical protein
MSRMPYLYRVAPWATFQCEASDGNHAMTGGHVTCDLGHLMAGGEGRIRIPIPAYLIQHSKGVALFDSGMHPDCQSGPAARVGVRRPGYSTLTITQARRSARA